MKSSPLLTVFGTLLLVGCTRPATKEDCTKIVEKTVELTLVKMNRSADEISKQKSEATEKLSDRIHECVGKRITNGMLRCVDRATAVDEVGSCMK